MWQSIAEPELSSAEPLLMCTQWSLAWPAMSLLKGLALWEFDSGHMRLPATYVTCHSMSKPTTHGGAASRRRHQLSSSNGSQM